MGNNKKKCVLVFSGFNQRAVIAFLRSLRVYKLDYAIIAKSQDDDIFLTDYKDKVLAVRNSIPLILEDLLSAIKKVKEKYQAEEYIIAPTTEALNRFLLENRLCFEKNGCVIPLVDMELYEMISNKYNFGKLCSENGIFIPQELDFSKKNSLPIVAKPKKYFSSIRKEILSPIIIKNSNELELFCKDYNTDDFYYQEFVDGKSIYLLYYFHRNGTVYKFSQENLIQQPDGKSMIAAISSEFHNTYESEKYEKLFKKLNYFGLVMIETKQQNDKKYMIEANPRFWGPSQLFVDAGINFFGAFLHDFGFFKLYPIFNEKKGVTKYFWFGGLINTIKKNLKLDFYSNGEEYLIEKFPDLLNSDIYRRDDTKNIFEKELFNG